MKGDQLSAFFVPNRTKGVLLRYMVLYPGYIFYLDYDPTGVMDLNAEKRGGSPSQGPAHVPDRLLAHYKKSPFLQ